jgi:hypothetical protein
VVKTTAGSRRRSIGRQRPQHLEPAHAGHLDVHEDEVRGELADAVEGTRAVRAHTDELEPRRVGDPGGEALGRQRLVLGDQGAHGRADRPRVSVHASTTSAGIAMVTPKP